MNKYRVKVRDENADYIIYHPAVCKNFPPHILNYPETGMTSVSIDVGIRNFAIRVETRYPDNKVLPVYMNKVDFKPYGDATETTGTTAVNPEILTACTDFLNGIMIYMKDAHLIGIERQLGQNYKSSRMFQHTLTYFLVKIDMFNNSPILCDISSKVKSKYLCAPKGLTSYQLKKWSVDVALDICEKRGDQWTIDRLLSVRGKTGTKADDMADTLVQMEALLIAIHC